MLAMNVDWRKLELFPFVSAGRKVRGKGEHTSDNRLVPKDPVPVEEVIRQFEIRTTSDDDRQFTFGDGEAEDRCG